LPSLHDGSSPERINPYRRDREMFRNAMASSTPIVPFLGDLLRAHEGTPKGWQAMGVSLRKAAILLSCCARICQTQ